MNLNKKTEIDLKKIFNESKNNFVDACKGGLKGLKLVLIVLIPLTTLLREVEEKAKTPFIYSIIDFFFLKDLFEGTKNDEFLKGITNAILPISNHQLEFETETQDFC